MTKSADAFRTIGEASVEIGVPHHVLRFWETRFPQLQPMKRGGNRRYYRPADMALLRTIHHMLHVDGLTIRGAQKALAEGVTDRSSQRRPESGSPLSDEQTAGAGAEQLDPDLRRDDSEGLPHRLLPIDLAALRAIRDRLATALAA